MGTFDLGRKAVRRRGATEGMMSAPEGDRGSGPEEEWSLTAHSPGQELWILRLEESVLLGQAAGDDDGLAGELALIAD